MKIGIIQQSNCADVQKNMEQLAENIADLFDALYACQTVNTGYYDPEEDARNNEVDSHTGFYYVTVN